ncbi:MAG: dockerin type I domain-containing protein [Planctomycetota bacterium]|nr:dockerin type I domain-containing protein [Planctomycetota bacterium]
MGGTIVNCQGKTTAEMKQQATFTTSANWDFTSVWTIEENTTYPELRGIGVNLASPTGVNATEGQRDGVHISWNAVTDALAYRVYRSETLISTPSRLAPLSEWGSELAFIDETAVPDITYYYWVTAAGTINGARESDLSSSDSGSRSLPPLTTPTNVTASNDSDAGVLLQWDAAPNANYYHVYRALTETSGKTPIGSWQGGLSLFDTSATPDTVYYYWATAAVDQLGERESNFGPAVAGMAPVAPPSLTITDGTILEGTSGTASLGFMVTLSAAATHDVTVSYATADGTATTADSDYQFINGGTLTIFAGQTTGTITVSVSGDSRVEPDENFYVNLSSASGATISDNQGQGTILSDDATIAGTIWDDADRDGLRDSGEAGLSGWTVYLDANNNSTFDTGETSVTSDASGSYSFTLNTGAYKVREVVQNDWQQTTPVGGVYAVTLTAGQNVTGKDFGNNSDEPQSLVVSSFLATSTGFVAQFNRGIETSVLNLYDQGNQLGVADVEMTGATGGPVRGSLVLGPAATQVRFIKTGGLLEPDSYTVRLRSGANGFRDPVGHLLDGDGNGTTGDDFVRTFSVDPGPVDRVTVTLPDFARGYGQPVNLPANDLTAGVPLGLSSGLNVSGIDLKLGYDPALLQVESFVLDSLVGARGASSLLTFPSPGTAILTISAPVSFAASSGSLTLGRFIVRVPDHAPYGAKHVLDIFRLHVFDATINVEELPSVDDDAIHVASYFGDTNASRTYNAPDVTLVQRIIGQINTGLATFQLADPRLVSDVTLNGAIQANDVTSIQRVIGQVTVPNVPSLPEGIVTPPPVGADPKLFIPQDLSGTAGSTVTVPISLRVTETGGITISGMDVVIEFDPAKFTVGNAQIGNLLTGSGFSGLLTNPEPGKLVYTASSASGTRLLTEDTEGTLFTLDFTIVEGTSAGSSSINLLSSYRTTVSSLFDNNLNALVLDPAPTNAASDAVDGKLTIGGGIQTGTIAGAVWKDADGDGIRDTGETGLSGWTVYLDTNNNSTFDTGETFVTSDASGNYSFTLNGGSYNVRDVVQNNWQQTAPAGGVYAVTLTAGQNVTGKDFGSKQLPATIAGTIWNDGDADGLHDTGEAGLSGWTVYLDTNNSNTFDTGETSVTSDANGNYGFTLNAGSYNVREVVQNNWQQTAPAGGVYAVTLTAGQNVAGKDFGNRQLSATITGTIWNDGDADGLHDTGEAGLSGWTVYLDTNNNNTFDTGETSVTSDASGNYSFTLNAGSYNVREVVQSNWRQTAPVGGVYAVTLTAGQNVAGKDFGVAPNGSQLTITYNSTIATSGSVSGIALSPDDTRLYAAYWEDSPTSRVRQYNLPDGQLLQTINFGSYHTHGDVVISADGNRIFTSNYYYDTVSQVDLANSNIITNQSTVDSWPGRVDIAPDRTKVLAAVGWDGRNYDMNNDSIAVYNIASGAFNRVASVKLNDEPQSAIGFSADSQYAYVGTRKRKSGSATLYEIALSGQPALTRSLPFAGVEILRAVVVASDKVFVSSAEQAKIWVVSRSSWTVISEITLPEGPSVLKMHPSGNYLFASLPNAKSVIAMDVASGQIVARYDGLQTAPSDIEFNSNGNKVYVSHITADGNVMVFDVSFGNAQWPWHNFDNPFDVDGQDVVSALDVLIMINYINFNLGQTTLPSAPVEPHPFYDVNADNACTGSDVLMVINYINSRSPGAAGEGEAAAVTLVYSSEHLSAAAQRPAANAVLPQTADWRDVESEQEDAALAAWSLVVDAEADSAGDRGPARGNHDGKKSAQLDINVLEDVLEIDTVLTAIAGDVARGWNRIP